MKLTRIAIALIAAIVMVAAPKPAQAGDIWDEHHQEPPQPTIEDIAAVGLEMAAMDQEDFRTIAKVIRGEGNSEPLIQKAAIVWVILNRVDHYEQTIHQVCTKRHQFAYRTKAKVTEENLAIARDVVFRWLMEKRGFESIGRILPKEYLWFASHGDGVNWFRDYFKRRSGQAAEYWDYSLPSPYDTGVWKEGVEE